MYLINELSHLASEDFAQTLLDNASKKSETGLVLICTNSGIFGSWQEQWREMAFSSSRWHFHALSEPAPWLSEQELTEAERRNSKARFNRLYWGVWSPESGDAIDSEDLEAAIDKSLTVMPKTLGWFYVAGVDLGIKHDHAAIVVVAGKRNTQELRVAYCEQWIPNPVVDGCNRTSALAREGPEAVG